MNTLRYGGNEIMNFIGVDACKKGWFAVALDRSGSWKIGIFRTIGDFWKSFRNESIIFIDIPIGLPDCGKRECDAQTRKILGLRAASVFPVPCREALQARSYQKACQINSRLLGVKLSIQTWNISAKIREVDNLLRLDQDARQRMRESHPELCFWALAGRHAMSHPKKTVPGFKERYGKLENNCPQTGAIVRQSLAQFMRKDLAKDDILDAIALAVSARLSLRSIRTLPSNPSRDQQGLAMEIVYALPA